LTKADVLVTKETHGMFVPIRKLRQLLTRREKWQAVALLGMMLFGAALEMLGVGAIPAFVTLLSDPGRLQSIPALGAIFSHIPLQNGRDIALWGAGALLCIFLIKNLYLASLAVMQARYVTNRQVRIAARLFETYLYSPYTLHLQRNTAELLRNATNEAMDVVGAVLMPMLTLSMEFLTITAILSLLVIAEPFVSVVAFVLLGGATAVFVRLARHRMLHYGQQVQEYRMRMFQTVAEGLGGIKITKVLGREPHFLRAFTAQADAFAQANRFRQIMLDVPRLYLETAAMLGLLVVAAILLVQKREPQTIIPTLSLLAVAVVRMIPSFNRITSSLTTIRYGRFPLNVVHADLTTLESKKRPVASASPSTIPFTTSIHLDDIHFTYPGANVPSIRGVSITIRRGEAVGLVGATGSGKTTLVDIILGLLTPTRGLVRIDERDLGKDIAAWQRRIGYVPQDTFLIDDSIRRNVALGLSDADIDEAAVRAAIEAAQLSPFVDSLEVGLDTVVG
jgi:ATP-binding cassette, subfamily B, bacterial PglK